MFPREAMEQYRARRRPGFDSCKTVQLFFPLKYLVADIKMEPVVITVLSCLSKLREKKNK